MNDTPNIFEDIPRGPSKELRILGALCYFPFGFVAPFLLDRGNDPFVAFHLRQGIGFFIVFILFWLFPASGTFGIGCFLYLIFSGITGYQAYLGKTYMMGFIKTISSFISKFLK